MTSEPTPTPRPRTPLSRERVLDAAIAIADSGGLEALSMRRLAQALGVEAMSLYNHVANKAEIVAGIADRVLEVIELPVGPGEWESSIRAFAISAHDAFVRHPWACEVVMSSPPPSTVPNARMRAMEWLLGRLREAGFPPALAYHAYHALDSHILGFTLWELGHSGGGEELEDLAGVVLQALPEGEFPHLVEHIHQHVDGLGPEEQREFAFGLDLILEGLGRRLDAGAVQSSTNPTLT